MAAAAVDSAAESDSSDSEDSEDDEPAAKPTTKPRHAAGVEATMYQGHELPAGWEQAWLGAVVASHLYHEALALTLTLTLTLSLTLTLTLTLPLTPNEVHHGSRRGSVARYLRKVRGG